MCTFSSLALLDFNSSAAERDDDDEGHLHGTKPRLKASSADGISSRPLDIRTPDKAKHSLV
jgi:hypothetical protein